MKYLKLLAMMLLPLSMVACSDDENMNTGNATVEFESATMEVRESTSMLRLPITVSGDHTGDIRVSAKMASNTANFELDKDVIITTEKLTLPSGVETVYFEVHLNVGNDAIETGRSITFEITEAVGATVGTNKTCTIELKENNPLEGIYTIRGLNPYKGTISADKCELFMVEGVNDEAYIDFGLGGYATLLLEEVVPGKEYKIKMKGKQIVGAYPPYGDVFIQHGYVDWNVGKVVDIEDDITGTYKDGAITLDTPVDYGFRIYCSAGYFGVYYAYVDETSGEVIPVTFTK